jgi:hypothetical protein
MKTQRRTGIPSTLALTAALIWAGPGCESEDSTLAPYAGGERTLSTITIEDSTLVPRITWLGGYATVLAVNKGSRASLDPTLVWLVSKTADALSYPVKYGTLPSGAQDLTGQYGGSVSSTLAEDTTYTYSVIKAEAWSLISQRPGMPIVVDSTVTGVLTERNDSVFVNPLYMTQTTIRTDLFINVKEVKPFGRLGRLEVFASDTTNRLLVTWTITQSGLTDSLIAAIGLTRGSQYDINSVTWELISEDLTVTPPVYFKNNVIRSPLRMGDEVQGAVQFTVYPANGLDRGTQYYLWIANKDWDGVNRTRSTSNYAFATFIVW